MPVPGVRFPPLRWVAPIFFALRRLNTPEGEETLQLGVDKILCVNRPSVNLPPNFPRSSQPPFKSKSGQDIKECCTPGVALQGSLAQRRWERCGHWGTQRRWETMAAGDTVATGFLGPLRELWSHCDGWGN